MLKKIIAINVFAVLFITIFGGFFVSYVKEAAKSLDQFNDLSGKSTDVLEPQNNVQENLEPIKYSKQDVKIITPFVIIFLVIGVGTIVGLYYYLNRTFGGYRV